MHKPLTTSSRLIILIIIGVLFAATLIALSVREHTGKSSGITSNGDDKKIEQSFAVGSDGNLVLNTDAGNLTIIGSDKEQVSIKVYARGSSEAIKKFDVRFNQEGNTITIDGELAKQHFPFFRSNWLDIQYDIEVPKKFNLNIQTSGGNIDIKDVAGRLQGETSGGNLELERLDGIVKLATSGGNVDIRSSAGEIDLTTSGGNILAESVTGPIQLETSGGNIDLREIDGKVRAYTSGGDIHASMITNKGIDLSTSGGNIVVKIPTNIQADISAETSGGDVSCELEYTGKIKEGRMKGKINGGGELINLETSGGDIMIDTKKIE